MKVFHGSNLIIKEPKIIVSNRNLDFGTGFYVTLNEEQAKNFAIKVSKLRKTERAYVNIYEIEENKFEKMSILKFDYPSEAWFDFVCENRQGAYNGKIYDIIYGPVANDDVYTTFTAYKNGILTKEQAIEGLKVKKLFNQILLTNERALEILKYIKSYEVG